MAKSRVMRIASAACTRSGLCTPLTMSLAVDPSAWLKLGMEGTFLVDLRPHAGKAIVGSRAGTGSQGGLRSRHSSTRAATRDRSRSGGGQQKGSSPRRHSSIRVARSTRAAERGESGNRARGAATLIRPTFARGGKGDRSCGSRAAAGAGASLSRSISLVVPWFVAQTARKQQAGGEGCRAGSRTGRL